MTAPTLRITDLVRSYGDETALAGVSLDVAAGEVLALLGPNGAGKTTLVSIVAGLLRPDSGSVAVAGVDPLSSETARALVGLAPQETGLYIPLTVRENLEHFARLVGVAGADRATRIDEVVERLLLADLVDRRVKTLSGGERRRAHTAAALLHRPAVLLLDEPTIGADVMTRRALIGAVRDLAARGTAVVYTTHYLPEVEDLGASIAVIDDGRIKARGSLDELLVAHGDATVEVRFRGDVPARWSAGERVDHRTVRLAVDGSPDPLGAVMRDLVAVAVPVESVAVIRPDLEAVFSSLTGVEVIADAS